jgi:CCR4-NOT transcriptional regulation complex NOT5 subunit
MKNTLSLISLSIIALFPVAAFAQNSNVSVQEASNSATAVGGNNVIIQRNDQSNIQNNLGIGSNSTPGVQQSVQKSNNAAAAIGNNNVILQNSQQQNVQNRLGINGYPHPYFGQ